MTSSVMKQKRQLFPAKLWDLVNNQPTSGIHWSKNGKRIEIDRGQLQRFLQASLLDRSTYQNADSPSCGNTKFRSHNFDSFIRQLHFYGFKKAGNSYFHEKFQRDRPEALCTMKRKYSPTQQEGNHQTISTMLPHQAINVARQLPHASASSDNSLSASNKQVITEMETDQTTSSNGATSSASPSSSSTLSQLSPSSPAPLGTQAAAETSSMLNKQSQDSVACPTSTIKIYTIDSLACGDGQLSFTNVRETSVKAVIDKKSVKISLPDLMMSNQPNDIWPKTLVLENQNILSAYFIYKLN
jgi:hypothetical protein